MGRKERFLKVYANLPMNLRGEVILVLDNQPISWNVAYIEVSNDTKIGSIILEKLDTLNII